MDLGFYDKRIKEKIQRVEHYKKIYNGISLLRVIDALIILSSFYIGFIIGKVQIAFIVFILGVIVFMVLAKYHEKVNNKKLLELHSIELNKDDIKRLSGEWRSFSDKGEEFLDVNHPYINDLNIFGENSFFQWINITQSSKGREKLKELLCGKGFSDKEEIEERQSALKELGERAELREGMYSALLKDKKKRFNEEKFLVYCEEEDYKYSVGAINIIRIIAPIITITALGLTLLGKLNFLFLLIIFMINLLVLKVSVKEVSESLELFEAIKNSMPGYLAALEKLEEEKFNSKSLEDLRVGLIEQGKASESIKELYNTCSWLYDRKNMFYIILNGVLYWDFQILYKAEKWKKRKGKNVRRYFEIFGEFEALSSLSILSKEREGWIVPTINNEFEIRAEGLKHPMLDEKAVGNDFMLDNNKRVALITGSNMSGKSTFLRTLGFSAFLTYLGLPVRAKCFRIPIMNIYSCMRTGDNLDESISSFYAEILRVKIIVEAVKAEKKVLFLLDEIFKGTNSIDRHDGAKVLINQLLKEKAMGLVSTHDLELCELEKESKEIVNYNFREYYTDNKLYFDYKLRNGISKTRNAKYLMKMAGIDI